MINNVFVLFDPHLLDESAQLPDLDLTNIASKISRCHGIHTHYYQFAR